MVKGGYKIVNLDDVNLIVGGDAVTIAGCYAAIESNHRKPILLSGIVVGGVEKPDMYISPAHKDNKYTASLYTDATDGLLTIEIDSDDGVKVSKQV